jgi:hypothetical protein
MEKIIRVCEITGRVTTVAEGLTTIEAMNLVRELSREDAYACYMRVVKR